MQNTFFCEDGGLARKIAKLGGGGMHGIWSHLSCLQDCNARFPPSPLAVVSQEPRASPLPPTNSPAAASDSAPSACVRACVIKIPFGNGKGGW